MESCWRTLPEDCVRIVFDFLGFPYGKRPSTCKDTYKDICACIDCLCERYSAAVFIFSLCLGFIMGEALSRI